jgi:hypothetical protein
MTKLEIELPEELIEVLKEIASENDLNMDDTVLALIEYGFDYLEEELENEDEEIIE